MATERARTRCRERLERLGGSSEDSGSLRREVIAEVRLAIGFDRWCTVLMDPDTLLAHTGMGDTDHLADMPRLQEHDASRAEYNSGVALAAGPERVGALSAATGGDLARSRRWRESLERYGTGDELRVVAADERGCWGRFDLWRDKNDRPFSAEDAQLLRDSSRALGRALRRSAVALREQAHDAPLSTGVLMIDEKLQAHRGTAAVWEWFRRLNPAAVPYAGGVPSLVWCAVGRLLAAERGENPHDPARIRVRAADGRWAVVEAARLGDARGAIAISIHAASVEDVLDLLCRAYSLSARELEVVRLIGRGMDTGALAERLSISRYTVQDHLKSIFRKCGASSRLELLTGLLAQAR